MKEGVDYHIVSPAFWQFLFDQYDCNSIIRIKYNKNHQLLTERSIKSDKAPRNPAPSANPAQQDPKLVNPGFLMNYDKQNPTFSILNIDDRRERAVKEKSLYYKYDDSQSHYQYALSKLWYNQWLEFVNSDVKVNKAPPGPIDNS